MEINDELYIYMYIYLNGRVKHRPGKPQFFNPEKFRPKRDLNPGLSNDLSNVMRP